MEGETYMMRAVVTGGTGFIGSWLILELLKNNIEVIALVRDRRRVLNDIIKNPNCCVIEFNGGGEGGGVDR